MTDESLVNFPVILHRIATEGRLGKKNAALLLRAADEITRLRTQLALKDWRTIDSAPKDGTRILGYDGLGVVVMEWFEPDADDIADGCCATWTAYSGTGEEYIEPTHWQPCPTIPSLTDAK